MNEKIPSDLPEDVAVDSSEDVVETEVSAELEFPVSSRRDFLRRFGLGAATLSPSYAIYDADAQERLAEVNEGIDLEEVKGMPVYDLGKPVKFEDELTHTPLYGEGGKLILLEVSRIRADREGTALGIRQTISFNGFSVEGDGTSFDPEKGVLIDYDRIVSMPFVVNRRDGKVYPLPKDSDGKPYILVDGRRFRVAGYWGALKKRDTPR